MQGTTGRRPGPTRPWITWALAATLATSVAVATPAFATSARRAAGTAPQVLHVQLVSQQEYTNTGITLRAGDSVSITASGKITFGGGEIKSMSPPGIALGAKCDAIARKQPRRNPFPAPKARCWSLIARVGAGTPFEVGSATTFRAARPGPLQLGLNDNFVTDNTGRWVASISVTRAPTTPTSPEPSTGSTNKTKKSSNTLVFALIGVAVLVALLALLWSRQRAKKKRKAAKSPVAAAPEDLALVGALATGMGPEPLAAAAPLSAPPETDSIDVNIFEVEFSNGLTLRIGYNHFPEGTELRWRVTQNRVTAASGSFIAKGGGSTNHVETVPLGVKLEGRHTQPDGADVQFDWSINGVPFRYSVRRDPNC